MRRVAVTQAGHGLSQMADGHRPAHSCSAVIVLGGLLSLHHEFNASCLRRFTPPPPPPFPWCLEPGTCIAGREFHCLPETASVVSRLQSPDEAICSKNNTWLVKSGIKSKQPTSVKVKQIKWWIERCGTLNAEYCWLFSHCKPEAWSCQSVVLKIYTHCA